MEELKILVEQASQQFSACMYPADLENAKASYLGKTGKITVLLKSLSKLSVDEKKFRVR